MYNSLKLKMADGQSEENAGPTETFDDQQKQQQKEFREKFAKMETELKEANQLCKIKELENRALQSELEKQKLMTERNALKAKIDMMEKEKEQQNEQGRYVSSDQMKPILDRINELEKQQKEQSKVTADELSKILEKINEMEKKRENTTKATSDQFSQLQNDQKKILVKISELDKEEKQKKKALLNFRQNLWDANVCHENLEIIGDKNLTVHHKGNEYGCCSVFAKHPILLSNNSSNIFYYEISVKNKKFWTTFGFAVKHQQQNKVQNEKGTYAYESGGWIWSNGKPIIAKYSYGIGDTVGIGVHLITRQLFFTKNGLRFDSTGFFVASSFADDSFHPFVSLEDAGDKIDANFGPDFKFDLATL
ncbi:hypothetical protein niasHS_005036 [Heterodera schachtii]|uniref:B30.2/SPRY domain-containing protein n=1 Tax=Heterodera schachtii TaxID=97005 RepID=A0ABD2JKU7_HETSC